VRLCESFVYADATSEQQVDVADAGLAIELLLSGRVMPRRAARRLASDPAKAPASANPSPPRNPSSSNKTSFNTTPRSKR
jgi:hypothetical protein